MSVGESASAVSSGMTRRERNEETAEGVYSSPARMASWLFFVTLHFILGWDIGIEESKAETASLYMVEGL